MPASPEVEHDAYETTQGVLRSVTYTCEHQGVVYVVTYHIFPPGSIAHDKPEHQLAAARDGSVGSTGGEIISDQVLEGTPYPGLETLVRVDGGAYRTRIFATDSRIYQLLVASEEEEISSSLSSAFLNSFTFESDASP